MLLLAFSIFLCSLPFAKCQQEICFVNNSAGGNCEVGGYVVPKSEIKNLQEMCISDDGNLLNENLNWLEFHNTQITGLQPLSTLCKNHKPDLLAWITWNKHSELFKGNELLQENFIFAKLRGVREDVYCSLDTRSGYCRLLFSKNAGSVRNNNFYLLVERKLSRYELRIRDCEKGYILNASEVVLGSKTISNVHSGSTTIKDIVTYRSTNRLKFKLDEIPIQKDVPLKILQNNLSFYASNDEYLSVETKYFPMNYRLESGRTVNIKVTTKEISKICEAKADLLTFDGNVTSETRAVSFEMTRTYLDSPLQHANLFDAPNTNSTWMTVLYVLGGLLILIVLICCWLKCCGGADFSGLCELCECCCKCCEALANCAG